MATVAMRGVLSASISKIENLSKVKGEVWKIFEAERERVHPQEVIVFNDGLVFHINTEAEYDSWSLETERYVSKQIINKKIVTISVFVG